MMKRRLIAGIAAALLSSSFGLANAIDRPTNDEEVTYRLYHSYLTAEACVLWKKTSPDYIMQYKSYITTYAPDIEVTLKNLIWDKAYKNTRVLREDRNLPMTICQDTQAQFRVWIDEKVDVPTNPFVGLRAYIKP